MNLNNYLHLTNNLLKSKLSAISFLPGNIFFVMTSCVLFLGSNNLKDTNWSTFLRHGKERGRQTCCRKIKPPPKSGTGFCVPGLGKFPLLVPAVAEIIVAEKI